MRPSYESESPQLRRLLAVPPSSPSPSSSPRASSPPLSLFSWRDNKRARALGTAKRMRAWWLLAAGVSVMSSGYVMTASNRNAVAMLTVLSGGGEGGGAASASSSAEAAPATSDRGQGSAASLTPRSLLNLDVIREEILAEAPWAESHGSDHRLYLGAGMLYYGFAYAFQAQTIVVLGSGGGFVPRVLRQAQRDLAAAGRITEGSGAGDLYLVDAHLGAAGWGSTFYAENLDTVMRQKYPDIHYLFNTTDAAFEMLKARGLAGTVDYLHVDADHSFEQSYRDFANYVQLLSPRGVVTFHDTCRDPDRQCRSGVPQTVDKVASELDRWGLQLLDAHYLYRGIAVAIRKSAPPGAALDAPPDRRRNFCKYNAHRLAKSSAGFSMNKRVGKLDTLGDFYECHKRFDVAELVGGCPYGTTRDDRGGCSWCIPGMRGRGCREFRYAKMRQQQQQQEEGAAPPPPRKQQTHVLAAAWLSGRRSLRVLELGRSSGIAVASLMHGVLSSTVVDPFLEDPAWTDDGDAAAGEASARRLPCRPADVMRGGRYYERFSKRLQDADAVVCLECDAQSTGAPGGAAGLVGTLLSSFPRAGTLVVEGARDADLLDELVRGDGALSGAGWKAETDVILADNLQGGGGTPRRMVMLVRA